MQKKSIIACSEENPFLQVQNKIITDTTGYSGLDSNKIIVCRINLLIKKITKTNLKKVGFAIGSSKTLSPEGRQSAQVGFSILRYLYYHVMYPSIYRPHYH